MIADTTVHPAQCALELELEEGTANLATALQRGDTLIFLTLDRPLRRGFWHKILESVFGPSLPLDRRYDVPFFSRNKVRMRTATVYGVGGKVGTMHTWGISRHFAGLNEIAAGQFAEIIAATHGFGIQLVCSNETRLELRFV